LIVVAEGGQRGPDVPISDACHTAIALTRERWEETLRGRALARGNPLNVGTFLACLHSGKMSAHTYRRVAIIRSGDQSVSHPMLAHAQLWFVNFWTVSTVPRVETLKSSFLGAHDVT
jgi:hypothetical protein